MLDRRLRWRSTTATILELRGRAPDPDRATRLSAPKISAALKRAKHRKVAERTDQIQLVLQASTLRQPPAAQAAFAVITADQIKVITTLNTGSAALGEVVPEYVGRHCGPASVAGEPSAWGNGGR